MTPIKPHVDRRWDLDVLPSEQRARVRAQLRQRRRWRFVVMWGVILFIAGVIWEENVRLRGSLYTASGIVGWICIIILIIGAVGRGVSSHRLKRDLGTASLKPAPTRDEEVSTDKNKDEVGQDVLLHRRP